MNPKPSDFPVGSPESRAAARMLAQGREDKRRRIEIVTNVMLPDHDAPPRDDSEPYATPWTETLDEGLMRILHVPTGMTEEEARRIVDDSALPHGSPLGIRKKLRRSSASREEAC